jgi:hypothetical protein
MARRAAIAAGKLAASPNPPNRRLGRVHVVMWK